MKRLLLVLTFVPALLATPLSGAEAAEPIDPVLADIAKARKDVKTLRASFEQVRKISLLATNVKSTGELSFSAPDRLRWDLAPPDDVVYFVGPEGLSYKTKSSTATAPPGKDVSRAIGDLRALLAGDLTPLKARYELTAQRHENDVEIDGTSLDKTSTVRGFVIVLDKGLVIPIRARLVEGKNDSIDLTFSNVKVNAPIDPALLKP